MTDQTAIRLTADLDEAEAKAWDSLGKYKFMMFGYWAGVWVHLNRVGAYKRPNPWLELVKLARSKNPLPSAADQAEVA